MAKFIEPNSNEELEELFEKSNDQPVILFKHSATCPISTNVLEEIADVKGEINLVVVQRSREISNAIEEKTGVRHQSPQAIVLRDGKPVYHASHYDITSEDLEKVLDL